MKILVAGDGRSKIHERAFALSLKEIGHKTGEFYWFQYFKGKGIPALLKRIQEKFLVGPSLLKLNADFERKVQEVGPEVIFIYRGTPIFPAVIRRIKEQYPGILVLGYNNDDPFSPHQSRWKWRNFLRSLAFYDMVYAYRPVNKVEYLSNGAHRAEILKPWYSRDLHYPVQLSAEDQKKYGCDVVFIGHYEDDWRGRLLVKLLEEGVHVRLFGPAEAKYSGWELALEKYPKLKSLAPFSMVWGEDYNKAVCGARITLCFMSKMNRDQYTRRCFEIPAIGGFLFSEYTPDLAAIFLEGEEAEYFRDEKEFVSKIKHYLVNEEKRQKIAAAGHMKVTTQGHDVLARAEQVVNDVRQIQAALS